MGTARYFVFDIEELQASEPREGVRRGPGSLQSFGLSTKSAGGGKPPQLLAPIVKVGGAELSPKEVEQERKKPGRVLERAFPIRLIAPMSAPVPKLPVAGDAAWGIGATLADKSAFDGTGVTVAVLDTGINRKHDAFAHLGDRLVVRDFTEPGGNGFDNHGHGSHCAGTIFGGDVGNTRIGIARNVERALVGKVLPDQGGGDSAMLFEAMQWASREGVNIVSMSLGFDFPGMVEQLVGEGTPPQVATSNALVLFARNLRGFDRLMGFLRASGDMLVVAAAGNESVRAKTGNVLISASLPSSAERIVAIGAYGRHGKSYEVASFSNVDVALCAPGVDILSADAGSDHGLTEMSGTSMACPHIAGLAALWWQKLGAIATPDSVLGDMLQGVKQSGLPKNFDTADYGRGRALAPKD